MNTSNRKTALILGAGASKNYGFPTGWDLAQELLKWPSSPPYAVSFFGNPDIYQEFKIEFECFLKGGGSSIDSFLASRHGDRFLRPARLAMSLIISKYEIEDHLMNPRQTDDHWYQIFYERITKGKSWETLDLSEITVITFNYDRSLEYFVNQSLEKDFNPSEYDLGQKMQTFDLTHVYGTIGLPWKGDGYERYAPRDPTDSYALITSRLKLIGEDVGKRSEEAIQNKIKSKLNEAETICFLGFGYESDNIKILGFPQVIKNSKPKKSLALQ